MTADTQVQRKARGAFFSPPELTDFIAEWAIRSGSDRVLEPSCGDGEFLLAAGRRLGMLGGGLFAGESLTAIEIHEPSAAFARERARAAGLHPTFRFGDFFSFNATREFDAVVGNPPYIRYQDFSGEARLLAQRRALEQGVRLTGLASSWAAFLIHAAEFLKPSGRLGLVIPAELLSVKYAAEVRRFLLQRFQTVRLVVFEELVFPGVQEEVVLLLAEGQGPADHFKVYQARDLGDLPALDNPGWTPFQPGQDGKWIPALLPPNPLETYRDVLRGEHFESLSSWGETYLGTVTGNNDFFAVSPKRVKELGLKPSDLRPISPPGSRHLRGLAFQSIAWQGLLEEDRRGYLFYPHPTRMSNGARAYIKEGEAAGVHLGYKCSNREPWWTAPLVDVPDLLLTYMDRERPRLVTNRARVRHLNSLYGVKLRRGRVRVGSDLLPIAALNSVTLLGSEMVGRAYGGGLLKLEPNEADNLPVPSLSLLETKAIELRALQPQLAVALRSNDLHECVRLVDRIVLTSGAGLTFDQLKGLRDARELLFQRRASRARGREDS